MKKLALHSKKKEQIDNVMTLPLMTLIAHRLPWLILGLAGGIAASQIVGGFKETLEKNIILAAFIPLIVYMSDAVGTQMEAFVIRDFALHPKFKFRQYFVRQLTVITSIGIVLSTLLYFATDFLLTTSKVSMVLAISLFFSVLSSVFSGLILPNVFEKLKLDPANASGPIATILQDIVSVLVYFSVARLILG